MMSFVVSKIQLNKAVRKEEGREGEDGASLVNWDSSHELGKLRIWCKQRIYSLGTKVEHAETWQREGKREV